MAERIAHPIFDAIDRFFDAERHRIEAELKETEAKRDLAKVAITWLASGGLQASDHAEIPSAIEKTPALSSTTEKELTTQEPADIMTTLRSDRNQPQEQTVSVY